jgi:four helix bundle protein
MGIRSFQDLDVYKRLRDAMIIVAKEVLPSLPKEEKFGLIDQMRRASKAPLAIIAEGYAKKNYKKDWMKYINDAIGECNEMIAHLSCCKDIYDQDISKEVIKKLIDEYDISGKQLYRLGESWRAND